MYIIQKLTEKDYVDFIDHFEVGLFNIKNIKKIEEKMRGWLD